MAYPLCVITPEIGVLSETFIRWDIEQLAPGRTVVVSDPPPNGQTVVGQSHWQTSVPTLAFTPVPGDPPPSGARGRELRTFLAAHGVEAVLIEYLDVALRWLDAIRDAVPRIVIRGHGVDLSARLRDGDIARDYLRLASADMITTPSSAAAHRLIRIGLPQERVHVFRQPVDVSGMAPTTPKRRGPVHCVGLGRLVAKKGIHESILAVAAAVRCGSDVVLDVIGDGPLAESARRLTDEQALAGRVRFHGALPHQESLALLRDADILLHHAVTGPDGDAEGLPVAVLEAMAAGLTVIATSHEGIAEAIDHRVSGLLVAEHDIVAMTEAIVEVAGCTTLRERLGRSAWDYARRTHAAEAQRQQMLSLLRL